MRTKQQLFDMTGKIAPVTGGTRRLGRQIAADPAQEASVGPLVAEALARQGLAVDGGVSAVH